MENREKLLRTLDALFGRGTSRNVPGGLEFVLSRKNGRIRTVNHGGRLLCTLRTDGGLAITPHFAQMLLKGKNFKESCVEIDAASRPFVEEGRSVFCAHVVWCGKNVRIASDAPVLFDGRVVAVGKAVLPAGMITSMERGVAVKVRDSLKGQQAGDEMP
ncbi:queuine tRNA-ribosyltransferase containing PUA domain [Cenarchaeum symbiosum A]|uniref:Queuine tRNA-ribosyltransferase containing PUA domain n=1 Tax=Cenarchaeum symbiosum (strain A) TaxID=414004 RepID=A0RYD5_CENSY|nr:queuine tRNA-ribosyltransferase containing PUA domain [Cenarchaeum symbiosum A]